MTRHLVSVLPLLAALLLAAPAASRAQQGAIRPPGVGIRVVDPSDRAIPGARVIVVGSGEGMSGDSGWVRLPRVAPGRIFVLVTRIGFRPAEFSLEVPATGGLEVDVELEPAAVAVQGVTAVATPEVRLLQMGGFYRRKEAGVGSFLTREQIEDSGAIRTSELFRRVQGVRVVPTGGDNYKLQSVRYGISLSERQPRTRAAGRPSQGGGNNFVCDMLVFLDGMQSRLESIDDIHMQSLEAVEVYRGPSQVPPEYNLMNSACGVVLLWTRSSK
jgi:hypothetical protein